MGRISEQASQDEDEKDGDLPTASAAAVTADTKPTALAALHENDGNQAKRKKKVDYQNDCLHGLETLVLTSDPNAIWPGSGINLMRI